MRESERIVVFDAYLNRLERKRRKPRTLANNRRYFDIFTAWAAAEGIEASCVTTDEMEDYFDHLLTRFAPTTVKCHLKAIRAAYGYALRRGVVTLDPTSEVDLPWVPDSEPEIISNSDLRLFRGRCRHSQSLALWGLLVYTGMRRCEICRLTWADVNFKTATLRVNGKQDKLRYVPIHPALAELLQELPFDYSKHVIPNRYGGEMPQATYQDRLRRFSDAPGHAFRRTFATSLYRNGVPNDTIDRLCGWAPRTVRGRYYINIADDQLQAAVLRAYADDPL